MDGDTASGWRDWELLTAWLRSEWETVGDGDFPLHEGMYEAYTMIAQVMRDSPPGEREGRLYQFLTEALTSGGGTLECVEA